MKHIPDAKVIAMINDLSPEALLGLVCFYPHIETKLRNIVQHEYMFGRIEAKTVIDQWTTDQ